MPANDHHRASDDTGHHHIDNLKHRCHPIVTTDCAIQYRQTSPVLGISIINHKANEREISMPAAISAYLSMIKLAMYGINLKYRFLMLCAMISSACADLICSLNGLTANGIGINSLPSSLSIRLQFWLIYSLAIMVSAVIPLLLTIMPYKYKAARSKLLV